MLTVNECDELLKSNVSLYEFQPPGNAENHRNYSLLGNLRDDIINDTKR